MSGAENGLQNVHPGQCGQGALMVRGTYIVKQCTFFVSDIKHKDKDEIYLKMGIEGTDSGVNSRSLSNQCLRLFCTQDVASSFC